MLRSVGLYVNYRVKRPDSLHLRLIKIPQLFLGVKRLLEIFINSKPDAFINKAVSYQKRFKFGKTQNKKHAK